MTNTNFWKLFCYGVNRDHYDKLICIRELSLLEKVMTYIIRTWAVLCTGRGSGERVKMGGIRRGTATDGEAVGKRG